MKSDAAPVTPKRDPTNEWKILFGLLAVIACAAGYVALKHHGSRGLDYYVNGNDFNAFYCAGRVAAQGSDPYATEPLRACEREVAQGTAFVKDDFEPAPLPGFDLAWFSLISRMPLAWARAGWTVVLLCAVMLSALLLARMTGFPLLLTLASLLVVDGYLSFYYGQLPPIAVLACCLAAHWLAKGQYAAAAIASAAAMIEPHVGLPVCAAIFILVGGARLALFLSALMLGSISVAFLGLPANVEYATRALSLHALAEASARDQFSLTWLLSWFGMGDPWAVRLGSLSYAVMMLAGIVLAHRLAQRYRSPEFIALFPVAAALFGGVFVHDLQMAAAMPAALLFAARVSDASRWRWVPVILLSVLWTAHWVSIELVVFPLAAIVVVLWFASDGLAGPSRTVRAAAAGLAAVAYVLVVLAIGHTPDLRDRHASTVDAFMQEVGGDTRLASVEWGIIERTHANYNHSSVRAVAEKLPTWVGLGLLLFLAGSSAPVALKRDRYNR